MNGTGIQRRLRFLWTGLGGKEEGVGGEGRGMGGRGREKEGLGGRADWEGTLKSNSWGYHLLGAVRSQAPDKHNLISSLQPRSGVGLIISILKITKLKTRVTCPKHTSSKWWSLCSFYSARNFSSGFCVTRGIRGHMASVTALSRAGSGSHSASPEQFHLNPFPVSSVSV